MCYVFHHRALKNRFCVAYEQLFKLCTENGRAGDESLREAEGEVDE